MPKILKLRKKCSNPKCNLSYGHDGPCHDEAYARLMDGRQELNYVLRCRYCKARHLSSGGNAEAQFFIGYDRTPCPVRSTCEDFDHDWQVESITYSDGSRLHME